MNFKLTEREREVIKIMAKGMTAKETAYELKVSVEAIYTHIHNIAKKTELKCYTHAKELYEIITRALPLDGSQRGTVREHKNAPVIC